MRVFLLALVALGLGAPAASAGTLSAVRDGTAACGEDDEGNEVTCPRFVVRYEAAAGEVNVVQADLGSTITVTDSAGTTPGPGCRARAAGGAECAVNGVIDALFVLGDLDDTLTADTGFGPSSASAEGGDGNDTLNIAVAIGGPGDDTLHNPTPVRGDLRGGPGNDHIDSDRAIPMVQGGDGDDVIVGGVAGLGGIDAGPGNDRITSPEAVTVMGGEGDDVIAATGPRYTFQELQTVLNGGAGADRITGTGRLDSIDGGAGDDTIAAGTGNDTVVGGSGTDSLDGGAGTDVLSFGSETRPVIADLGDPAPDGVAGELESPAGFEVLRGGAGDDSLTGTILQGGAGDDPLTGTGDADDLGGDQGEDTIDGLGGDDRLSGSDTTDTRSDLDRDVLRGGPGDDFLEGENGDELDGGAGNDQLSSFLARDVVMCGSGNDDIAYPYKTQVVPLDCEGVNTGGSLGCRSTYRIVRPRLVGNTLVLRVPGLCRRDRVAIAYRLTRTGRLLGSARAVASSRGVAVLRVPVNAARVRRSPTLYLRFADRLGRRRDSRPVSFTFRLR